MFNNLQLFAHNARLRHIWRAATLRPKFSREELSELNISEICEEILNPHNFAVLPLGLKATLLGGLAIVHEQKVELFYSDMLSSLKAVNAALPSRRSERIRARANPVIPEVPHAPQRRGRKRARANPVNPEVPPANNDVVMELFEDFNSGEANNPMADDDVPPADDDVVTERFEEFNSGEANNPMADDDVPPADDDVVTERFEEFNSGEANNPMADDDELLEGSVSPGPTFVSTQPRSQSVEQHFDVSLNRFRKDIKNLVDAPNSASVQQLSQLTNNMSRKDASMFFYHTCALATEGVIKVEQEEPYGDVLITRGSKTV